MSSEEQRRANKQRIDDALDEKVRIIKARRAMIAKHKSAQTSPKLSSMRNEIKFTEACEAMYEANEQLLDAIIAECEERKAQLRIVPPPNREK